MTTSTGRGGSPCGAPSERTKPHVSFRASTNNDPEPPTARPDASRPNRPNAGHCSALRPRNPTNISATHVECSAEGTTPSWMPGTRSSHHSCTPITTPATTAATPPARTRPVDRVEPPPTARDNPTCETSATTTSSDTGGASAQQLQRRRPLRPTSADMVPEPPGET